jgi:endonuclease G
MTEAIGGTGYDAAFLPQVVGPPGPGLWESDLVEVDGRRELSYTHFSLAMSASRRLARWVAWNIDGAQLPPEDKAPSRAGLEFRPDPRLPESMQVTDEVYADNSLDRGHVARRYDLVWGPADEANRANFDSFYFTNITPQRDTFNQSGRHGLWGLLENALIAEVQLDSKRVSVFGGPILGANDPVYRGVQVPLEFWKTLVYRVDAALRARSFLLTQSLTGVEPVSPLDEFRTYEIPLADLEARTGLDLDDPVRAVSLAYAEDVGLQPRALRGLGDIAW